MKTKLLFILLLLLPVAAMAQKLPRQILNGKVIADSLKVENLSVLNINSNIGAVTDNNGEFTIYARPTDTLFFSSITFRSRSLVLKEIDFLQNPLIIRLDVNVTMLDEVIISPNTFTGELASDSKNIKTNLVTSGIDSYDMIVSDIPRSMANQNGALTSNVTGSALTGVNFNKIYDMIFKKRKKKDAGEVYGVNGNKTFVESAKERFTHHFFTVTLKIPHEEIGAFLAFCDGGVKTSWMLDPKNEFYFTDYLVTKSKEYLKKDK